MSNTLVLDRIESNLTRLRLPRIREILERIVKEAEKQDKSHLSFLDELLEEEVAHKEQRRRFNVEHGWLIYPRVQDQNVSFL